MVRRPHTNENNPCQLLQLMPGILAKHFFARGGYVDWQTFVIYWTPRASWVLQLRLVRVSERNIHLVPVSLPCTIFLRNEDVNRHMFVIYWTPRVSCSLKNSHSKYGLLITLEQNLPKPCQRLLKNKSKIIQTLKIRGLINPNYK